MSLSDEKINQVVESIFAKIDKNKDHYLEIDEIV